jgi:hypothetical protein
MLQATFFLSEIRSTGLERAKQRNPKWVGGSGGQFFKRRMPN